MFGGRRKVRTTNGSLILFRHREFRAFWTGALISNVGTWMQNVSVPYALYQTTGEARWVGIAAVAQFLPSAVAGPLGGVLADRVDRKRFLFVSQLVQCAIAVAMWLTWTTGAASPSVLVALLAVNGLVYGGTAPCWQAFVGELAPAGTLVSAITLNSAQLNAARAVGPALAGIVIAECGAGTAFLVNALSYSGVIGALLVIRTSFALDAPPVARIWQSLRSGGRFVATQTHLRAALATALVTALLLAPMQQFLAVVADEVGATTPRWYGAMTAAYGFGASFGAIALAVAGSRLRASTVLRWSLPIYAGLVLALSRAHAGWQCVAVLPLIGASTVSVFAVLNTSVQRGAPTELRGRILSIYLGAHSVGVPLGSWMQGVSADRFGVRHTLAVAALSHLAFTALFGRRLLGRLDVDTPHPDPAIVTRGSPALPPKDHDAALR